jgi:hypothetical protein
MRESIMSDDQIKILKVHEVNKTDMVERFLLEMLLTHEWSDEFHWILVEYDDESTSLHMADYLFKLGLLKYADSNDLKYAVSNKGRKYLEQRS